MNIRDTIVSRRLDRIRSEGHALGARIPGKRTMPVLPFGLPPGVICEVKRRSPSKGNISMQLDPVKQVSYYAAQGVRSVSVLTEEDNFAGSLEDLVRIKQAYPKMAVLRKDFLVDLEDVEVSCRAGADAILLIASMLDARSLREMHDRATALGMSALVELHDEADVDKARPIAPPLVGINSRNLETFTVDPIHPIALKAAVSWAAKLVYESGISCEEDARLAAASGFDCVLVGEAVVRTPALVREITNGLSMGGGSFWADLFSRRRAYAAGAPDPAGMNVLSNDRRVPSSARPAQNRPLVKICGLTNPADVEAAIRAGADALGFIFAPSPRRVDPGLLRTLGKRSRDEPVRVGVVVSGETEATGEEAFGLLEAGLIDAIQFHGDETPAECYRTTFPYFKALSLPDTESVGGIGGYRCPRVLVDASAAGRARRRQGDGRRAAAAGGGRGAAPGLPASHVGGTERDEPTPRGGTGQRLAANIVTEAARIRPLWLAGGLNADNIAGVVKSFSPELVDASSGLESSPGTKDHEKLHRFFDELRKG